MNPTKVEIPGRAVFGGRYAESSLIRLICISSMILWIQLAPTNAFSQVRNLTIQEGLQNTDLQTGASPMLPPNIWDIEALLERYQPSDYRIVQLRLEMQKSLPISDNPEELASAWHKKAHAAKELQEMDLAEEFYQKAIGYADLVRNSNSIWSNAARIRTAHAVFVLRSTVGLSAANDVLLKIASDPQNNRSDRDLAVVYAASTAISSNYTLMGDTQAAKRALARADQINGWFRSRPWYQGARAYFVPLLQGSHGQVLEAEGKLEEAERAMRVAISEVSDISGNAALRRRYGLDAIPDGEAIYFWNQARLNLASNLIRQQRLDEAEILAHDALKNILEQDGRNSFLAVRALRTLSEILTERGRDADALALAEWSYKTSNESGFSDASPQGLLANITLANTLVPVGRSPEAIALIEKIQRAGSKTLGDGFTHGSFMSVLAYLETQRFDEALIQAKKLLQFNVDHLGKDNYTTAESRAFYAMALRHLHRSSEARTEFRQAISILLDPERTVGRQQSSAARANRLRLILNEYLVTLTTGGGEQSVSDLEEAFRIADVARWQNVQKAVSESGLRAAASTPELSAQIKKVQDANDEIQALYSNLVSQRSLAPENQLPNVIAAMELRITALQIEQKKDLLGIRKNFPKYDELAHPRPASLTDAQRSLLHAEAMLSIYVTKNGSYIWATGNSGKLRFHFSPKNSEWVREKVESLRRSVDMTSGVNPDKMHFDLAAGVAIYQELLAPVEEAWAAAETLVVVVNDSLGQVPFSMLPTGVTELGKRGEKLALSEYRNVPWLARKLAVTYVPSISALVTLRSLSPSQANRLQFVGFGDPEFGNSTQLPQVRGSAFLKTRNVYIKPPHQSLEDQASADADLSKQSESSAAAVLSQLPDTREEITAIATALSANLQTDVYFGANANRQNVLAADLKRRRIVAFATHGLVAGDLPGLSQPALALSPGKGRTTLDGLLKLDDILKLSLDADLVVLSACNTAAADGTGSEAVSGLGRGFFYAGSRSVLATHWPVETVSAKHLVRTFFERYSSDGTVSRAHSLRRAMLHVMDVELAVDDQGKPVSTYAHPAFWAPYALYGDPGR